MWGSVPARNMKGMMTFDRKTKKDSYFWYKANWTKSPVLHMTQRRNTLRERKETSLTVYSKMGTPKVYLNGRELQGVRQGYTDVHYIFDKVLLDKGKNRLRAVVTWQGKEYVDEMEWEYRGECNREADFMEHTQEHGSW